MILSEISENIEYFYGIRLTQKYIRKILKENPILKAEIKELGFDTGAREEFVDKTSKLA